MKRTSKAVNKRAPEPAESGAALATAVSDVPAPLRGSKRRDAPLVEISWPRFDVLAQGLARSASRFAPQAVVGVAKGGVFVGGAVAAALKVEFFPVRISRRSRDSARLPAPRLSGSMPTELEGLRILVVDDVAASGETLKLAVKLAGEAGASRVKTATLARRKGSFAPDYVALETDAVLVFPWDYDLSQPG